MMNRFYIDCALQLDDELTLSAEVFHHWCCVLRAKINDQAILFNGQGGEYLVTLTEIHKNHAMVKVVQFFADNRTLPANITIGLVMSKGDRVDYAIQKATELGVSAVQLLTSERCEMRLKYQRDQKKLTHWQGIAIAACEQSGLNIIPKILAPIALSDWVQQQSAALKLVMALQQHNTNLPQPLPSTIAILIGPEGGLSPTEISIAQQHGFLAWTVGSRTLRTETAPVVALSILNYLL